MRRGRRGPGLVGTMARTAVVAGTATAVSGKVARNQQAKYEAQHAAAAPQATPAPAAAAPAGEQAEDPILVIQKLAALRDQGILTEEEFTAKKAQILGI